MTKIEWTQATWSPVTGCTKVSAGCKNCYAERMAKRLAGRYGYPKGDPFAVTMHPDRIDKIPTADHVFVCSMSDPFHPKVPDKFLLKVFGIMALHPRQVFQVLTKRPERALQWLSIARDEGGPLSFITPPDWPLRNVWLGVSVEDQKTADERIPILLQTPAAVRFVSYEPALGAVNFTRFLKSHSIHCEKLPGPGMNGGQPCRCTWLDWVICGSESGPGARPMHPDWARSVRDQCVKAGVPFFFKQWGEWLPHTEMGDHSGRCRQLVVEGMSMHRVGKKAAGRVLDGRTWDEMPDGKGRPA